MLWIGDRTRQPDHAHVEFCRGVKNPIGLKCGPSLKPDGLLQLIDIAQSGERAGPPDADLPLRRRQGRGAPAGADPRGEARRAATWCGPAIRCTATPSSADRLQDAAVRAHPRAKSQTFFDVHRAEGTHAGGIHVEMTGKNVTECTGGARAISDEDLNDRYHTIAIRASTPPRRSSCVPGGGAPQARPPGPRRAPVAAAQ